MADLEEGPGPRVEYASTVELLITASFMQAVLEKLVKPKDRPGVLARQAEILDEWGAPGTVTRLWSRRNPETMENARQALRWLQRASVKLLGG